jgi:hypothetical protein
VTVCPYCLSEVDEAAVVCKTCTRDLYLFKPMMARIAELEAQVRELSSRQTLGEQADELVERGAEAVNRATANLADSAGDITRFILAPLILLLIAHALITVVYDLNVVYLRLISMLLPLPFGFWLFRDEPRTLLPWFVGTAFLAVASVIGMSAIVGVVDQTPLLPRNAFEWRELLEYSASIAFSFLTGMLISRVTDGKVNPGHLHTLSTNFKMIGGSFAAILTTIVSIYTGLKGVYG